MNREGHAGCAGCIWSREYGPESDSVICSICSKNGHCYFDAGENRFSLQMPYIQHVQHGGEKNAARIGAMSADEPLRTVTALPKGGGHRSGR